MRRAVNSQAFLIRFWDAIEKSEDPDACWGWKKSTNSGYGQISPGTGRSELAHRLMWEIQYGPIPDGLFVLHRCDNRPCTNPRHLFLGTQTDNLADMTAKGRRRFGLVNGTKHGMSKMTEETVRQMRALYAAKQASQNELARRFGISQATVNSILLRKTWHHVQ